MIESYAPNSMIDFILMIKPEASMTLNQLRYFCTAARCRSITKAAKLLFVSQPAVSLAIRQLEKEFSMTLFAYTNKSLELTKEGAIFYERSMELLKDSDEMRLHFLDSSRYRPTVKLGIPPLLSTIFFPDLMDAFHVKHPDIYLELSEYGSVRASEMVQDEQLDIGLVNMESYNIDRFSNIVLANDKLVFCVCPEHPLAHETSIALDRLDQQPLILFNHDSVQNQVLMQYFHSLSIEPRIIMHCSQIMTTLKFLRQGKCGTFFFSSMRPYLPDVVCIPVSPIVEAKIGLIWKKGKYMSTQTQTFVRFCERYYKDNPLIESKSGM